MNTLTRTNNTLVSRWTSPHPGTPPIGRLHAAAILILLAGIFCATALRAQNISTVAGNGTAGYTGDGGQATSAKINLPYGVATDANGDVYIADFGSAAVRKVSMATGIISTVAGNGTAGFGGDSGLATSANLDHPFGVATDNAGNLFIAEFYNNRIRKVVLSTGIITTVAGNGTSGFGGDNGPATSASLQAPTAVAADNAGNLYIADLNNNRIRKVVLSTGIITTVAGTGVAAYGGDNGAATSAYLQNPSGVALDNAGHLFIVDYNNHRIRSVDLSTGIITTVAGDGTRGSGGDNGAATSANLNNPIGIAFNSGNLYIGDAQNNRIRQVSLSSGIITTIAGTGTTGSTGDGAAAVSATLNYPAAVSVDAMGRIFIAETGGNRIRMITAPISISNIPASPVYNGSFTPTFNYSGDGTASATSSTTSVCTVSSGLVSFLAPGNCTLTASATAGTTSPAMTGSAQSFTVGKATPTISIGNLPPTSGVGGSFLATYSYPGDGTTSVSSSTTGVCTVSGNTVSYIAGGTCTLIASATAGTNYAAVTGSPQSFTIATATSTVTVTCPPATAYTGSALTPCTGAYSTSDGPSGSLSVTYSGNTNAGTATASASWAGDATHVAANGSATFTISPATPTVTVTCSPSTVTYTGSALTPCSASYSTSDGLSGTLTPVYSDNTNAGTASATASYAGDTNHAAGTGSATFTIAQATATVAVSCSPSTVTYTGSALTPCSATATGAGGLSQTLSPSYSANTNAGTASASASYAGDTNHTASTGSTTFTINQAPSTVTVTCSPSTVTYTGSALTPCTAVATGAGDLSQAITPTYTSNTNAGTATAAASYAGDANHTGNTADSVTFTIARAASTTTVAAGSYTYDGNAHAASATVTGPGSGLTQSVTWSWSGSCTGAPVTVAQGAACTATASYAGDANHLSSTGFNTVTIQPRSASVATTNNYKYYDTSDPATLAIATLTGFLAGDNVTASVSRAPGETVGLYPIAASLSPAGVLGNYAITNPGGTFTITTDTTVLTYTGPTASTYGQCGSVNLSAVLLDAIHRTPVSGAVIGFVAGTQTGTATTDATGTAYLSLNTSQAPGNITVSASYGGSGTLSASGSGSTTYTINPNLNAGPSPGQSLYTGAPLIWTAGSGSNSASVTLSTTVQDLAGCSGRISNSTVTFAYRNGSTWTPIPGAQNLKVGLVSPTNPYVGTASAIVQMSTGGGTWAAYDIAVILNGSYLLNNPAYDQTVMVAQPGVAASIIGSGNFNLNAAPAAAGYLATGAGTASSAIPGGTANYAQVTAGVTYNKSFTNPQGKISLQINTYNRPDGSVDTVLHTYRITSSSIASLSSPLAGAYYFSGKSVVQEVTGNTLTSLDGGATFQMTTLNPDNLHANGQVTIQVQSKSGTLWFASGWNGIQPQPKALLSGGLLGK